MTTNGSNALRQEIARRARELADREGLPHYLSLGMNPTVMFEAFDAGRRHGNFLDGSYQRILARPAWRARLEKPHPQRSALPMPRGAAARELDSSNSSDALLMNVVCHPDEAGLRSLLGIQGDDEPQFGVRGRVPLRGGAEDQTELDMVWSDLIVEAKLTEADFKTKRQAVVERYAGLEEAFDTRQLPQKDGRFTTYQLIRNVLAAHHQRRRFLLLCDARRPDLLEDWSNTFAAIRPAELRARCRAMCWQDIAGVVETSLAEYLVAKYGIARSTAP